MNCILCGNENLSLLTDTLRNGKGNVLYCKQCDFGILEQQVDNPAKYYAEEYRKTHRNAPDEDNPEKIYNNTKIFQKHRKVRVEHFTKPQGSILEIGCSAGQFLSRLKDDGYGLYGVEYDPACRQYVKDKFGITVYSELPDHKYDAICLFQTLEHTVNPVTYIKLLKQMLNPDGKLFIEVPNLNDALRTAWENEAYEKFYFHEAHNWYFTERAIYKLAETCGVIPVYTDFIQDYSFYAHLQWHFLGTPTGMSGLKKIHPAKPYAKYINQLDKIYRLMLADGGIASNIFTVFQNIEEGYDTADNDG